MIMLGKRKISSQCIVTEFAPIQPVMPVDKCRSAKKVMIAAKSAGKPNKKQHNIHGEFK